MATSIDWSCVGDRVRISGELYHRIPCRIHLAGDFDLAKACWEILCRIDDVFNVYRNDSELGRINASGPGRYRISTGLAACLRHARRIEHISGGAWSATMLPLVRCWRQARDCEPDAGVLAAGVAAAHDAWDLDGETLIVHKHGGFDLGGLAKGFAVDQVVDYLHRHGIEDYLVQVGGETACAGHADHGGPHRVGIPHPDDPDGSWCAVLRDPGTGICGSTSGDYRQGYLTAAARHRHHIIDPRSGQPVSNGAASITCVFTGSGHNALADGLTTALSVAGTQALAALCGEYGCAGMALRRDPDLGLRAIATATWADLTVDDEGVREQAEQR